MKALLGLLLICLPFFTNASCLEQRVSVSCTNCTREVVLEKLQAQINCNFSYNASLPWWQGSTTINGSDVPLRQMVQTLTEGAFEVKTLGRHVMLVEREEVRQQNPPKPAQRKQPYIIEGYVKDRLTGEVINYASIYTIGDNASALTDAKGYYRLTIDPSPEPVKLSYSKEDYLDTLIIISPAEREHRLDLALEPRAADLPKMPLVRPPEVPVRVKEVEQLPMVKVLVPQEQSRLALNSAFLESIPVQLSLVPSIGTNKFTSGMKENMLSINLLSGYNAGVKGVEAGGLVNIVRRDVQGLQGAGLGNIVGGKVRGIQAAGVFNNVRGSIQGFQGGGVYNIVLDTIIGVQAAGVFNILNGSIKGVQMGGLFNIATEDMEGLQAAGLLNLTRKNVRFAQVAGLLNQGGSVEGLQLAGFMNLATNTVRGAQVAGFSNITQSNLEGVQVAGFMNIAQQEVAGNQVSGFINTGQDVTGMQLSGFMNTGRDVSYQISAFLNVGKKVEGVQAGFLNVADSSKTTFGFLSFVKKGMHHIDVAASEVHPLDLSFRTGSHLFYNILLAGFSSYYPTPLLSFGYGVGSHYGDMTKRVTYHSELTVREINVQESNLQGLNLNIRFEQSFAIQTKGYWPDIILGPSLNLMLQSDQLVGDDLSDPNNPFAGSYPPIFKPSTSVVDGFFWIGARVGIRI